MYSVSFTLLKEILETAGCESALAEIELHELKENRITTCEISFEIEQDGDDKWLHINEFNIFLNTNVVLFGKEFKHENDFTIEWAPTEPRPNAKILTELKL